MRQSLLTVDSLSLGASGSESIAVTVRLYTAVASLSRDLATDSTPVSLFTLKLCASACVV